MLTLDEHERRLHALDEAYERFHNIRYKELLSPPEPNLPHFLEIAYHRFSDSCTERSISANSRNLLNLLGRSLLFFMLEDVAGANLENTVSKKIADELHSSKPPSDGRLLEMQINLIHSIDDEKRASLVTENLMILLPDIIQKHLRPVVEKRNRANHPPFDEIGFIEEAQMQIPIAIKKIRKAFRHIELIIPMHFTSKDGKICLKAQSLTGLRFEYPQRDFASDLEHTLTPCDTLLLCRVFPNQSASIKSETRMQENTLRAPHTKKETSATNEISEFVEKFVSNYNKLIDAQNELLRTRILMATQLNMFFN
jgi:hypothetical protein